ATLDQSLLRWEYKKPFDILARTAKNANWLGMRDSNPRMHGPEPCALPLGQSPITVFYYTLSGVRIVNIKRDSTHLWRARRNFFAKPVCKSWLTCELPLAILTPNAWTRTMCHGTFRAPKLFLLQA
ncbi:MAG: Recombinase, partial [Patescibacteria group bacterium]|nr:Recombinase [Patescibacteria group bacterium]